MSRRVVASIGLALCTVAVAAGCGTPTLDPSWRLHGFRVIGVRTTPADPLLGTNVTLEVLTVDPGRDRHVTARWWLCQGRAGESAPEPPMRFVDAGPDSDASGAPVPLEVTDDQLVPDCPQARALGDGERLRVRVPAGGFTRAQTVGMPSFRLPYHQTFRLAGFACAGGVIVPPVGFSGGPRCQGPDAAGMMFTTLLYARAQDVDGPNENPVLRAQFAAPGAPLADLPAPGTRGAPPPRVPRCEQGGDERSFDARDQCTVYRFAITLPPAVPEYPSAGTQYTVRDADGGLRVVTETLATQMFVSGGGLSFRLTGRQTDLAAGAVLPVEWRAPRTAGVVSFVATAQDNRGAFNAIVREVVVE